MLLDPIKNLENLTKEELLIVLAEEREIKKSLQICREKYENLLDISIDGVYKCTPEGKFIEVNNAFVKMLGYSSKEELLNVDTNAVINFKNKDKLNFISRTRQEENEAIQFIKKDGSIIWVEVYGKNKTDEQGQIMYHEGIIRDVAEIKKANIIQKALLKISQAGYKAKSLREFNEIIMKELGILIDTTNFYIAFYNEGRQTINIPLLTDKEAEKEFPATKTLIGYLINKKFPLLIKSKDYKELVANNEINDSKFIPKAWLGVPLRVDDKVIGAIVVQSFTDKNAYKQNDIELLEFVASRIGLALQRKNVMEEMAMSKQVLRKVLDNIPIKVFWKDKESRFLGCNMAYLKDLALDNENQLLGKTDFDIHQSKEAQQMAADELKIMLSRNPKLNYEELITRTGTEKWMLVNKLPFFDTNDNVIGIIGTAQDITQRRETESKLKVATEEAIAANLSKSTFLSNMSHEIRTPMNAILGYSQLLQDDNNLTKEQQENLKTINKSGEHLLALINDVLDMSKIEAGRITLTPSHFNFMELLKEVE
jgi:PAS domain S-box-containing protein